MKSEISLLKFRADYPEASIDLYELIMYLDASKAILNAKFENPTNAQIIEFSKVVVASADIGK